MKRRFRQPPGFILIVLSGSLVLAGDAQGGDLATDCCAIDGTAASSPSAIEDAPAIDCCADLDSRVSELEAATKKGNGKVSLTVQGVVATEVVGATRK